jgi:predicted phage terminase large subunit-like protein
MGQPRPRGSSLFKEIPESNYYTKLPERVRYGVGYDLAYTAKTYADWSVAVVMATDGRNYYIVDVVRKQCDAVTFANALEELRSKYPHPVVFLAFIAGPEKGSVSLLNSRGLKLTAVPARTDKYDRAQAVSAAWNLGHVYLPKSAPWLDDFITEISHFTGVSDPKDDQVDALAGAFASLRTANVKRDLTNLPSA